MFLFISLPGVKRTEGSHAQKNSLACFCHKCGSVVGLMGGLLVAIAGSLLTAISWLVNNASLAASLHQTGSVLLCATVPLLILGAFCLDGVELQASKQHHQR